MKKLLLVFALIFVTGLAFASTADNDTFVQIIDSLDKQSVKKLDFVAENSYLLDNTQRYMLYRDFKKDTLVPFLINFTLGLGVGSYMQGDMFGGTFGLVGDVLGATLLSIGLSIHTSNVDPQQMNNNRSNLGSDIMTISGAVVLAASRIYQLVRPFTHANKYNKVLKNALFNNTSVAVVPYSEKGDNMGLAMVGKIIF